MSFSTRLKMLRKQHNLTQKQVAQYLHISRPTVAGYETRGRQPSHEKLSALAELFNVSVDYLLCDKEDDMNLSSSCLNKEDYNRLLEETCDQLSDYSRNRVLTFANNLLISEHREK